MIAFSNFCFLGDRQITVLFSPHGFDVLRKKGANNHTIRAQIVDFLGGVATRILNLPVYPGETDICEDADERAKITTECEDFI